MLTGNVVFANFHAARVFAQKMNEQRDLLTHPEQAVRAGQINAMGLIDEILHHVVAAYRRQVNPGVVRQALGWMYERLGERATDAALRNSLRSSRRWRSTAGRCRSTSTWTVRLAERRTVRSCSKSAHAVAGEREPGVCAVSGAVRDASLEARSAYPQIMSNLHDFFDTQPPFGPDSQNLIDVLRSPAMVAPDSLSAQLAYMRSRWVTLLGDFIVRLLGSLDMIAEEEKPVFFGQVRRWCPSSGASAR